MSWDCFPLFGIDEGEFWRSIDSDFWANLEPTAEFEPLVKLIDRHFDPSDVCILSAPGHGEAAARAVKGKQEWLAKHLPQYKNTLFGEAKHFCAHSHSILIDDSDTNISEFAAMGGCTAKFPRPWNRNWNLYRDGRTIESVEESLNWWITFSNL